MTSFTDGRDSGAVLVTHFTLLLGMAAPVWLSNAPDLGCPLQEATAHAAGAAGAAAASAAAGSREQQPLWLAAFAGILILGARPRDCDGVGLSWPPHGVLLTWHHPHTTPQLPPCHLGAGFGDTAASAVGSLWGRRPLCAGCSKTWEGCAAALAATLAAWWLLLAAGAALPPGSTPGGGGGGGPVPVQWPAGGAGWAALGAATAGSCLLEGFTTQLDNAFMPLHYFALLCLL